MFKARFKQSAALAIVAVALAACGGPGAEEFDQLAAKHKLNKIEKEAMVACYKSMSGTKPIMKFGSDEKMMSDVPIDICACQSKAMVSVFQDDKYGNYARITKWLAKTEKKNPPALTKKDLKPGRETKASAVKLIKSFESCAIAFVAENKDKEEFKNLLEPPPPKPVKKGEEKKQASAG